VAVLRQALTLAEKDHAVKRQELRLKRAAKQADVEVAQLELRNLELERKQAVLCAPMDGILTTGDLKVGDLLEPGKAVVEMAAQKGFVFEATVPNEEVANLRVGLPTRIRLDAYDYQSYGVLEGTVRFLSPDSTVPQGQKAALYVVRIELDSDEVGRGELRGPVKLGMAGQVEIVTDQESLLKLLLRRIRQSISLG
jgi:HlyD family secretion protein